MDIHILTPFYRKDLAATLIYYWRQHNIFWYPLMAPSDYIELPNESWIRPVTVEELKKGENCFVKVDYFREHHLIIDEDYYGVTCDETIYEPGFMDVLRQQTAKIVVCSSYRGNAIPKDGSAPHPVNPLIIRGLQDIKYCGIGMGQWFVKGDILRSVPYHENKRKDDGQYAMELKKRYPTNIVFIPEWFSLANYLQKGRHTKKEKFLKSHWELPEYK
jgi:hypothetical protein